MHAVLAIVLLFGEFTSHVKPTPSAAPMQPIQAVAIDKSKVEAQLNKIKKKKAYCHR